MRLATLPQPGRTPLLPAAAFLGAAWNVFGILQFAKSLVHSRLFVAIAAVLLVIAERAGRRGALA